MAHLKYLVIVLFLQMTNHDCLLKKCIVNCDKKTGHDIVIFLLVFMLCALHTHGLHSVLNELWVVRSIPARSQSYDF
jgi:hypothetical protein